MLLLCRACYCCDEHRVAGERLVNRYVKSLRDAFTTETRAFLKSWPFINMATWQSPHPDEWIVCTVCSPAEGTSGAGTACPCSAWGHQCHLGMPSYPYAPLSLNVSQSIEAPRTLMFQHPRP